MNEITLPARADGVDPIEVVEGIFTACLVRYGDAWLRMWDGVPMRMVHRDWALQVGYMDRQSIQFGLDNLPDRPPIATQFKAICLRAPPPPMLRLEAPRADQGAVDAARDAAAAAVTAISPDPLAGARRLRARELALDRTLTPAQKEFWRTALADEIRAEQEKFNQGQS